MGIIIAKFRKQKSTFDALEKLENEITSIQEFGRNTEQTRKKIVGRFLLFGILVYVIIALLLYLYYNNMSPNYKIISVIPLVALPFIIWLIKSFLTWWYSRKIRNNEKKLVTLKNEKKKILDNVMETETYKVAKKILDKFGNESAVKPGMSLVESTPIGGKASSTMATSILRNNQTGMSVRQRHVTAQNIMRGRMSFGGPPTPQDERHILLKSTKSTPFTSRPSFGLSAMVPVGPLSASPIQATPPLPRNVLPRERSVLDKMVDYLVGDGPSNRYALICNRCQSHNGMALKEEFEYLSFRCCYCSAFNPARKKRPSGPTFNTNISPSRRIVAVDSSESDKDSDTDSETESPKPIVSDVKEDMSAPEPEQLIATADLENGEPGIQFIDQEYSTTNLMETSPVFQVEPVSGPKSDEETCLSPMEISNVLEQFPDEEKKSNGEEINDIKHEKED